MTPDITTNGLPDRVKIKVRQAGERGRRRQNVIRDSGRADKLLRSFACLKDDADNG